MDKIKIYKCLDPKPAIPIRLNINGEKKYWIIQNSQDLNSTGNKIAYEYDSETFNEENELEFYEEGNLSVEYFKNKKIKFTTRGLKNISGSYIFYVPSWGYHTQRKIWILIPVINKELKN